VQLRLIKTDNISEYIFLFTETLAVDRGDNDPGVLQNAARLELIYQPSHLLVEIRDAVVVGGDGEPAEIDGQPARATGFRREMAEVQRLRLRYEKLYVRKQPVRNAVELARLAEQLGRGFEAQALFTLAIAENPDRADLPRALERLMEGAVRAAKPRQSLADAITNELANDRATARAPSR
jgi:hypothetical protein